MTLQGSFTARKIWDKYDQRAQAISTKIIKMMASDNQPFSMVEDQGFIELIVHLEPHYLIPSRTYFTKDVLPKLYSKVKGVIAEELDQAKFISFTSDLWTCSNSNESFISLTGHWLNEDFSYKSAMLNARHFPGRHTGALIESNFNLMLSEWSIDHSHIQMLVRDGASNIAQQYLSTPASSVNSERLFSEAGNILEEKRSRLLPRNVEKLLFLHHNLGRF